ncbi:hypothetical protein EDD11_008412 [Mortierella claussenii]|nr:hypothetical protein EDD11_008412 [Mortierella claussenii]
MTIEKQAKDEVFFAPVGDAYSDGTIHANGNYCFKFTGKVTRPFPGNSKAHLFLFGSASGAVIKDTKQSLCQSLTSGPSEVGCPEIAVNENAIEGCINVGPIKVSKSDSMAIAILDFVTGPDLKSFFSANAQVALE